MKKEREKFGTLSPEMVKAIARDGYVKAGAGADGRDGAPPEDSGCERLIIAELTASGGGPG
jgi:hypothetical protein